MGARVKRNLVIMDFFSIVENIVGMVVFLKLISQDNFSFIFSIALLAALHLFFRVFLNISQVPHFSKHLAEWHSTSLHHNIKKWPLVAFCWCSRTPQLRNCFCVHVCLYAIVCLYAVEHVSINKMAVVLDYL